MWQRKLAIVMVFLALIFSIFAYCNAESAIVSFNSPEHLVALQDSVVSVCDTVDSGEDYIRFNEDGSSYVYNLHTITCRELVCVTANWPRTEMKWLPREDNYSKIYLRGQEINIPMEWREVFMPGEAVIWFKNVERAKK